MNLKHFIPCCNINVLRENVFIKFTIILNDLSAESNFVIGWFVGFYGISIFVGYLTPNSFLFK